MADPLHRRPSRIFEGRDCRPAEPNDIIARARRWGAINSSEAASSRRRAASPTPRSLPLSAGLFIRGLSSAGIVGARAAGIYAGKRTAARAGLCGDLRADGLALNGRSQLFGLRTGSLEGQRFERPRRQYKQLWSTVVESESGRWGDRLFNHREIMMWFCWVSEIIYWEINISNGSFVILSWKVDGVVGYTLNIQI